MQNSASDLFSTFKKLSKPDDKSYEPVVYDATKVASRAELEGQLKDLNYEVSYHDTIESQIKELFKIRNPRQRLGEDDLRAHYQEWKRKYDPSQYGCYVYYPWRRRLVHMVGEQEFIELRTARNKYKITQEEQDTLATKKVGVIGLSVGQSVSLTMAMERVFGCIRLADFDELELSNMNRIRTGVYNLGLPKTVIVAREIAEIDPFLEVELFPEGITEANIDAFLGTGEQALDVLVEECDSLDVKIMAREKARARRIPVLMDTSDRGMLDIERFDREPERPLLHGRVGEEELLKANELPPQERMELLLRLMDFHQTSNRMKKSMGELGKSIITWPQLASEVIKGGGITTEKIRGILQGEPDISSGRFYFDRPSSM